eukprot:403334730
MVESKTLKYLDPDLYVKAAGEGDIEQHYICLFCYGVVLDPTECRECQSLYCKGCFEQNNYKCPKRCEKGEYQPINRYVKNQLNKMQFKCQNQPECTEVIEYESYIKHYRECGVIAIDEGCGGQQSKQCQKQIEALNQKVQSLELKIENLEKIVHNLDLSLQNSQQDQINRRILNCPQGHPLYKFKNSDYHPIQKNNIINIHCDYCSKIRIHVNDYYRCNERCDFDICNNCYLERSKCQSTLQDGWEKYKF